MRCAQIALVLLLSVSLSKGKGTNDGNKAAEPPQYEFGDIISSTMTGRCGVVVMKHYVVYLGKETFEGKNADQDIFHRWEDEPDGCRFGILSKGRDLEKVAGYDYTTEETTKEKMKQRITDLVKDCGQYDVLKNNCEQTATYVRFKEKMTYQDGALAGFALRHFSEDANRRLHYFIEMVTREDKWRTAQTKCKDENNNQRK